MSMNGNGMARKVVKKAIAKQDKEGEAGKPTVDQVQEAIRLKAYELYLERGGGHGNAEADWVSAERIILGKIKV